MSNKDAYTEHYYPPGWLEQMFGQHKDDENKTDYASYGEAYYNRQINIAVLKTDESKNDEFETKNKGAETGES